MLRAFGKHIAQTFDAVIELFGLCRSQIERAVFGVGGGRFGARFQVACGFNGVLFLFGRAIQNARQLAVIFAILFAQFFFAPLFVGDFLIHQRAFVGALLLFGLELFFYLLIGFFVVFAAAGLASQFRQQFAFLDDGTIQRLDLFLIFSIWACVLFLVELRSA